jgi:2-hydroxychromene-2-carboxylate isomerase
VEEEPEYRETTASATANNEIRSQAGCATASARTTLGVVSMRGQPVFIYDFNSPYAYLASTRVEDVLPVIPRWQPVALAFMLRAQNRIPWSLDEMERRKGITECERRARAYGLGEMQWPPGWPVDSYGLTSLRAALVAAEHALLREFSRAAFARHFVQGLGLKQVDDVLAVADEIGLDRAAVEQGIADPAIKDRLTAATNAALTAGAVGVPTIFTAGQTFWGDDQLEPAAAATPGNPS